MTWARNADRLHGFMDRQCKWIVSSAVFTVCLANTYYDARTVVVPYFVLCALLTALAGKGLKRVLNHKRPAGAAKQDAGMPSSHAVSLGFLSNAAALWVVLRGTASIPAHLADHEALAVTVAGVGAVLSLGAYFSLLRIRHNHHTIPQVAVGYCFGAGSALVAAAANYYAYTPKNPADFAGGRVNDTRFVSPAERLYLNAAFVATAVFFALKYTRRWLHERPSALPHSVPAHKRKTA